MHPDVTLASIPDNMSNKNPRVHRHDHRPVGHTYPKPLPYLHVNSAQNVNAYARGSTKHMDPNSTITPLLHQKRILHEHG